MARNDRAINRANRNIRSIAKGISGNMDALYRSTYMSAPQQSNDLKDLNDRINRSLDNIVTNNMNTVGVPSVTQLYNRIASANNLGNTNSSTFGGLMNFEDSCKASEDMYSMFVDNRFLKDLYDEIDSICTYMPSLEEALDTQKDCVLSADNFSKDFLNLTYPGYSVDPAMFSERAKDIKKKYNLPKLAEEIYDKTSKYGERFVYRVPYKIAIARLLANKEDNLTPIAPGLFRESYGEDENGAEYFTASMNYTTFSLNESASNSSIVKESTISGEIPCDPNIKSKVNSILDKNEYFNLGLRICRSNVIESAVYDYKAAMDSRNKNKNASMKSLYEQAYNEASNTGDLEVKGNIGNTINTSTANDGLISGKKEDIKPLDVAGCVVKQINPLNIIPIYIEDMCMGYYYLEVRSANAFENNLVFGNLMSCDPTTNVRKQTNNSTYNTVDPERQDEAIKYMAGQLSKFIDRKFVNHNNDLAREIYQILKYNEIFNCPSNEIVNVTFIPPEDMVHFYFNMDEDSHRGISDLYKSIFPAKIYTSLYITYALAHLTRGQDKRVYYVKQTVDTNIAQTLLNTISQIKMSNFGLRQFQNLNNILNITGRFNDYVIPTNASGDAPIQFEIMPGQDIQEPTELMEQLKDMAINATGIPVEIIQARQSVDYAMQLTMSSSKVLRWCYKRQELFESMLSDLITSIYNYEYNESIEIKVTLPPPSFINVTNTNQLVDNTKTFVQSIVDIELANSQDEALKNAYSHELFNHYLGTHIDVGAHKDILDRCRIKVNKDKNESHTNEGESDY